MNRFKLWVSTWCPILGAHFRRLGIMRTAMGGLPMYLAMPIMVLFHFGLALGYFQWMQITWFGGKPLHWKDYIIIDRHRISGLGWLDRMNCAFCGYANGVITMINKELDACHFGKRPAAQSGRGILLLSMVLFALILLVGEIVIIQLFYNLLISRPLRMKRVSYAKAAQILGEARYFNHLANPAGVYLLYSKNLFLRIAMLLEQIESAWCPLRHFENRTGVIYPDHHKRFFGPTELERMEKVLLEKGSVL